MKKNYFSFKKSLAIAALLLAFATNVSAQTSKLRVLFVGNSFTAANNLPEIVRNVTASAGDSIFTIGISPGGYSLENHSTDPATISNIAIGNWNYVVLQEQSQRPAFPDADVATDVYPYATRLDSLIHATNKCGRTMFFQTWGYRDGDALNCPIFPPICTYKGMDSMLAIRYDIMANTNRAVLSPVGTVFKAIRTINPSLNLYEPDGSHPSANGSYAAAVTFYTVIFKKNPKLITFNSSVLPADADFIRQVVFDEVFKTLTKFYVDAYEPKANFTSSAVSRTVTFNSGLSENVGNYYWTFGDGGTDITANPVHTYATDGSFNVKLVVDNCIVKDSVTKAVSVIGTNIKENSLLNSIAIFPNPTTTIINLKSNISLQHIEFTITNLLGMKVLAGNSFVNNSINIESLNSGVYFLKLTDSKTGAIAVKKIIKD